MVTPINTRPWVLLPSDDISPTFDFTTFFPLLCMPKLASTTMDQLSASTRSLCSPWLDHHHKADLHVLSMVRHLKRSHPEEGHGLDC